MTRARRGRRVAGRSAPSASRLPAGFRRTQLQRVEINCSTRFDVHEIGDADLEGAGDREEHVHRRIPSPALDFGEVSEREADLVSRVRLRPAVSPSGPLNPGPNTSAERRGAHPENETSSCFNNVTHYRSLSLLKVTQIEEGRWGE